MADVCQRAPRLQDFTQSGLIVSVTGITLPTLTSVGELRSDSSRSARHGRTDASPVFTDPSGQRRRLMRLAGAGGSVVLVGALVLVGIGLTGGPDTPFSVFSAPHRHSQEHRSRSSRHGTAGRQRPGSAVPSSSPDPPASPQPSPSASPSSPAAGPSPTTSPGTSPAPTNKAGKTPPGRSHSAHPHPSPHGQ